MSIGRMLLKGAINIRKTSKELAISRNTVKSYIKNTDHLLTAVRVENCIRMVEFPFLKTGKDSSYRYM